MESVKMVKGKNFSYKISPRDIMHGVVTIVNNTVLHI